MQALLVCEDLQMVRADLVLIVQHMVVGWAACPLQARMADQEEVMLSRMCDAQIHHCACRSPPNFSATCAEAAKHRMSVLGCFEVSLPVLHAVGACSMWH